jgi:glycosyltransferase involved in cell wall biosynthesis
MTAPINDSALPRPVLRLRLIGKSNGVGLSRDLELLAGALAASGCEVTQHPCERGDRKRRRSLLTRLAMRLRRLRAPAAHPPFDVNVMLEHIWPQFVQQARLNVLVPNPEWTDRRDLAMLRVADRIWAKTALAEQLFAARGSRVLNIGFDSEDRLDLAVPRMLQFLHLAGRSPLKGTQRLLALWRRHPEWPQLTVLQDNPAGRDSREVAAANIVLQCGFASDQQLRTLQNAHRFHLCLSEAEGWGHYIAEAMSVGAITLTTDAAPMNELIGAGRGLLVAAHLAEQHNLARIARFDERALEAAIAQALLLDHAQLDAIGAAARSWFLANKRGFAARVRLAVDDLRRAVPGDGAAGRR